MPGPVCVRFADRSLKFRQLRRRSNNLDDFGLHYVDSNKASQYIPCLKARKPGPDRSHWIRMGQRDSRSLQIRGAGAGECRNFRLTLKVIHPPGLFSEKMTSGRSGPVGSSAGFSCERLVVQTRYFLQRNGHSLPVRSKSESEIIAIDASDAIDL